jgi:hypothetical protein
MALSMARPSRDKKTAVRQFMRENWISNRVFTSYTDILDHCCDAGNKIVEQPWTIMSIGLRDWVDA